MAIEARFAAFKHPQANQGAFRFDLTTNGLLGLKVVLDKHLHLGDLGIGGFSYLQEVSSRESQNLGKLLAWKRENAPKLIGKSRHASFVFADDPTRGGVKAVGMIRNLEILLLLRADEVETEAKRVLSASKYRPQAEEFGSFAKLELMIQKTASASDSPSHKLAALIGLNVSMHGLMEEVGAGDAERTQIFKDYSPKRTFIKFGLSFADQEATEKLLKFANPLGLQALTKVEEVEVEDAQTQDREEPDLWFDVSET